MSEKLYRILVTALLAAILALQAYAQFKPAPVPAEACEDALRLANVALAKHQELITNIPDAYDKAVYDLAENINQQILLSGEQQFILLLNAANLNASFARVQLACR